MKNQIKIHCKQLSTNTQSGTQKNTYTPHLVLTKRCFIKDRSLAAQDSAINNGIKEPDSAKEFILKYFDVTDYQFNQIEWNGIKFKVLNAIPVASATIGRKKYFATDQQPFISILAGVQKL